MSKRSQLLALLLSITLTSSNALAQRYNNINSTDADASPVVTGNVNGELLQQVIALEEEVRRLRGDVEKNNFEINRLKTQMKRMGEDVDFRLKSLEPTITPDTAATGETSIKIDHSTPTPIDLTVTDTRNGTVSKSDAYRPPANATRKSVNSSAGSGNLAKPGTHFGDEPRQHYNQAFRLLNQNRYKEADAAFASFTEKYPEDPLIGNAYYWLGETHYIRQNYVEAADHFRQGYQKLPDGPKAPDNLLKLAMSLKAQERTKDACVIIEQITKKFKHASSSLLQRAKAEKKLMGCE